jgi:hypothetical protein
MALYTTVYPAVESYWHPFLDSVARQTDRDFDLWIGIDGMEPQVVEATAGVYVGQRFVLVKEGRTPSALRVAALAQIVKRYDAVVLADSDDLLLPSRVEAARASVLEADIVGCALELVDVQARCLNATFGPEEDADIASSLPYTNAFGFSNTVYRSSALRRCLTTASEVEILDWFLATRAWLFGARFAFDSVARMRYRQHVGNTAGVLGPFTPERIRADILRVMRHYDLVLNSDLKGAVPVRRESMEEADAQLLDYWNALQHQPDSLVLHAQSVAFKGRVPLWWEWVSAPMLSQQTES